MLTKAELELQNLEDSRRRDEIDHLRRLKYYLEAGGHTEEVAVLDEEVNKLVDSALKTGDQGVLEIAYEPWEPGPIPYEPWIWGD